MRAAERTPAAVLDALRNGSFYASSGPAVHDVAVTDAGVEVRCSPARPVTLRSGPWDGGRANADPRLMHWRGHGHRAGRRRPDHRRARCAFPRLWRWGRVEVQAADGTTAWTNPMPLPLDTSGGPGVQPVIDGGRPRALIFDFNGTLSDDETIMYRVFAELFARHGRPLSEQPYLDELAGLSDEQIVTTWLGAASMSRRSWPSGSSATSTRSPDADTVGEDVRRGVLYAASRVPVLIVSGAAHAEIEGVLAAARAGRRGDRGHLVRRRDGRQAAPGGLPASARPCSTSRASTRRPPRWSRSRTPRPGVASAKAAGMRCIAVAGTLPRERLAAADSIVPGIGESLIRSLLD